MRFSLRTLTVVMLLSGPVLALPWWMWRNPDVLTHAAQLVLEVLRSPSLVGVVFLTAMAIFAQIVFRPLRASDN